MGYDQHPIAGRAGPIAPLARLSISSFVALWQVHWRTRYIPLLRACPAPIYPIRETGEQSLVRWDAIPSLTSLPASLKNSSPFWGH
jgi:hypothetical protein